jgi:polysaccharide deacetylase family protein (PEP-CTERM system associated)
MSSSAQILTIDVEEYFQVNAFERHVGRSRWDEMPSRVAASVDLLLERLASYGSTATFFTLGWVAAKHPEVPRRIVAAGHEIAAHGWWHRRVPSLSKDQFRDEVRRTRDILEDLTGTPCLGHRAPSFSLLPGHEWAYDVLIEEGYVYDSSVFPIRRRNYGNPAARTVPHVIEREFGRILELPLATTRIAGVRCPGAGGAYLRLLPFGITRRTAREHAERGEAGTFYVHPWEVDPDQPRLPVPWLRRLRHYGRLERMLPRLERLLGEFSFVSVRERYGDTLAAWADARPETPPAADGFSAPLSAAANVNA